MIEMINNTLFHWLYTAPLLYRPIDWGMAVGQIYVLRQGYKALKIILEKIF